MGRRPKSDEEKELSGAYAKNPQRRKKRADATVPVRDGLGDPPSSFLNRATTLRLLEAWRDIKAVAKALGVELTEGHRIKAEALARAMVIMRWSEKTSDCANVAALEKEVFGKVPTKREADKAAEKPEADEWSHLTTPPARPVTPVQ